jgi:hypothetical protein
MNKRFGVLRFLSALLKIVGVVVAALSIIGGIICMGLSSLGADLFSDMGVDSSTGVYMILFCAFMVIVAGILYAILLYGYGELLMVLLGIEDNTFRTVTLLEEVTKEEK